MNTVQPIRDPKLIALMKEKLHERNQKYYILFLCGINIGLRVSDVLTLKVSDVIGRSHIIITEQKTGKTKRFMINDKLLVEIERYVKDNSLSTNDYLIRSRKGENKPLTRIQAYRILNDVGTGLGLQEIGTHTMRKTFGYWHYKQYKDIAILQDIFNHSAPSITLRYIGINDDMKDETIKNFYL
jgi:integrase